MIESDGLSKEYDSHAAVDHLDLSIEAGAIYGFLGPNGAGKTTTIEMLTTLLPPTDGHATVAGHSISDREAVKPHIGYLPAEPPVYDAYSGREQLEYVGRLRGLDAEEASAQADSLLARVGLLDSADRRIDTYSTGMRQKVGLLQTMLHDPAVIFLDEPTTGLDPRAAREVVDLITELSDDGTTVFLSTHILPVVDEIADRIGVLHEGSLVAEGSPESLKRRLSEGNTQTLERAFLDLTDDDAHLAADAETQPVADGGAP